MSIITSAIEFALDLARDREIRAMEAMDTKIEQLEAEIERLLIAFRVNMLRLDPTISHAEIDKILYPECGEAGGALPEGDNDPNGNRDLAREIDGS